MSNLPAHLVSSEIGKHMSPKNMASLVRTGKAGGALENTRANLKKEGDRVRPLRVRGLVRAVSKLYGRTKLRRHPRLQEAWNNDNNNPYYKYINLYKWLSVIKPLNKKNSNLTHRLTEKNISEIQKNILRKMKPNRMYPNKKNQSITFSGNGVAVLRIISPLNADNYPSEAYAKMYIEKKQGPGIFSRYRIAPFYAQHVPKNYMTHVPLFSFHRPTNNLSSVGYVETITRKPKVKKTSRI